MSEKASGVFVAAAIARAVRAQGGRALVVGGWVRDRLLEAAADAGSDATPGPKDLDMEVFGIPAAELPSLLEPFGNVEPNLPSAMTLRRRDGLLAQSVCFTT